MSTTAIKKSFHSLIDSIDNENILLFFYALMKRKSTGKEGQLWNMLSKEEDDELLLSYEESDEPRSLVSQAEMKYKHRKWL